MIFGKTKIELGVFRHPIHRHDDWIYQDIEVQPGMDVDIVCDAKSMPMIESGSMDEVYASHIAEHFHFTELWKVLSEWVRILKPGGWLTIVVPDFLRVWELLLSPDGDEFLANKYGVTDKTLWALHITALEPLPPHAHRNHSPYYFYTKVLEELGCTVECTRRHLSRIPEVAIVAKKK